MSQEIIIQDVWNESIKEICSNLHKRFGADTPLEEKDVRGWSTSKRGTAVEQLQNS
jgi:hypothetical protein